MSSSGELQEAKCAGMGRQGMRTKFWWRNLVSVVHFEDRKGDGRIILIWILKEEGVDWIRMAQVRVQL